MALYGDTNGNQWDDAESALEGFLSELPYLSDEETESVFQFTNHASSAAENLKAIAYGVTYSGLDDRFAGDNYPVPEPLPYVATVNTPGYLPISDDVFAFATAREAWQYLLGELERTWDAYPDDENGACIEAHTQLHGIDQSQPGTIYAPTPGYEGEHDLGVAYSVNLSRDSSAME